MSNRLIKFLIIFLLIFSAQLAILQILLLRPQSAQAALPRIETKNPEETKEKCSCSSQSSSANEIVQLYIPIPWVTDGCGYVCDVNNDGKANVVDYVVSIYKFLVGLAAILAVIMIVWGGLLRIFSGGQANRISASNDTIVSAIIGLVLALISVSLLQAINPALTNIELPSLTNIGRVSVAGIFATDDDIMLYEESEMVALHTQNNAEQKAEQRRIASIVSSAQAQTTVMSGSVDDLLRQEMAYDKDETPPGCTKDTKEMCFLLTINPDDHTNGKLIKGNALKCNSVVDVKVAHINFQEETDYTTGKKIKTNVIESVECYHGLCDEEKNTNWKANITAISNFITANYPNITYDQESCKNLSTCIISSEGKDVGSAFAYGQDCSEIGSTGLCLVEFGKGADAVRCIDVKSLCENSDKTACDDVNNQIHNEDLYGDKFSNMGCARRYDNWSKLIWAGDNCVFGPKLMCPPGWNRVSYSAGPATDNIGQPDEKGVCWKKDDGQKAPQEVPSTLHKAYVLDNYQTAIEGASGICCSQQQGDKMVYQKVGQFFNIKVDTLAFTAQQDEYYLVCQKDRSDYSCQTGTKTAGINEKGEKLLTANGIAYTEGAKCQSVPILKSQPTKIDTRQVQICMNSAVLKECYVQQVVSNTVSVGISLSTPTYTSDINKGFYGQKALQKCLDNSDSRECDTYLVPTSFCCIGETIEAEECGAAVSVGDGGDGGGGVTNNDINQTLNNIAKNIDVIQPAIISNAEELKKINKFQQQEIALSNYFPNPFVSTVFAGEKIDACLLIEAIITKESGGKINACNTANTNGSIDCGIMQFNIPQSECQGQNCSCQDSKCTPYYDPATSISAGVGELLQRFNENAETLCYDGNQYKQTGQICNYDNTTCKTAAESPYKNLYQYVLAAYNGGEEENCNSIDCTGVTKWECDINPGGVAKVKQYVKDTEMIYNELKMRPSDTPGLVSCP